MEDVAQAMTEAENSSTAEIRSTHRDSVPAPPSNYAWPQYQATNSDRGETSHQFNHLRRERTEHREKYRSWESDKVLCPPAPSRYRAPSETLIDSSFPPTSIQSNRSHDRCC
jgi:hypothetical protein